MHVYNGNDHYLNFYSNISYTICIVCVLTVCNPCDAGPCQNGATCHNNGDGSYRCECPMGYEGTNCETCKKTSHYTTFYSYTCSLRCDV